MRQKPKCRNLVEMQCAEVKLVLEGFKLSACPESAATVTPPLGLGN